MAYKIATQSAGTNFFPQINADKMRADVKEKRIKKICGIKSAFICAICGKVFFPQKKVN